jgi:hypothetical protein
MNPLEQRFCSSCGSEVDTLLPGLTRARADAWRDQFQSLGWWDLPETKLGWTDSSKSIENRVTAFNSLLKQFNIPTPYNNQTEPWVFICKVESKDWSMDKVTVN